MISAAIAISLLILTLTGTELGYLFSLKRDFQKTADLAALAGAQALRPNDCGAAQTAAVANAARNLPAGFQLTPADVSCGRWDPIAKTAAPHYGPLQTGESFNAVKVNITRTPALLLPNIPGNLPRQISVQAFAAQRAPRAMLNIRNALLSVDTTKSPVLNAVLGGLLGGSINLSVADWNGLISTDVNLLKFLDQLALKLNVGAGRYDEVLTTQATVGTMLDAMIKAMQAGGTTAQATITALGELKASANLASAQPLVRLGDLLGVQTGTPAAGLDVGIQAFQIIEGLVQLANRQSTVVANVPITVPGLVNVSVKLKVGQSPRVSAIGDPELAALDPTGPNAISVQTAQMRALVSVNIPLLDSLAGLTNAVAQLLAPVTTLLNNVLTLNLQALIGNVICLSCTQTRTLLVTDPLKLSIYLQAPTSSAHVTAVDCNAGGTGALDVREQTSIANLIVGTIASAAEDAALAGGTLPAVSPIPLFDTQKRDCTTILGIGGCTAWVGLTRTGLKADSSVGLSQTDVVYSNPPLLDAAPAYKTISATNIVNSLKSTLAGLQMQTYKYIPAVPHFGDLVGSGTQLVQAAVSAVTQVISILLAPLLDQLLNTLLNGLGIQLAQADVGARLSCTRGAELVY